MHFCAAFYLAGALAALSLRAPPSRAMLVAGALAALIGGCSGRRAALMGAVFSAGFVWAGLCATFALTQRLDPGLEGRVIALGGTVATFPRTAGSALRFELSTAPGRTAPDGRVLPRRLAVTWTGAVSAPRLGDWCELRVRLRRPRGLASPGVASRERDYAARGLGASGWVVAHPGNLCADIGPPGSLARVRVALSARLDAAVPSREAAAVLRALAVADRGGLGEEQWRVMRVTGTGHLLAVSGLHVSLVAAWVFACLRVLAGAAWCRDQRHAAIRVAWGGAALAAFLYAALAGFGVPVRRAAIMVAVAALAACRGRRVLSAANLSIAATVVATLDPLVLVTGGFWLSFCAAGLLVGLATGRRRKPGGLGHRWRLHVALAVGLAPLTALLFGEVSLSAPLANLLAVPACALLVVPLTLAGAVFAPLSETAATLAWNTAANAWLALWFGLEALAALLGAWPVAGRLHAAGAAVCLAGLVLFALPRGTPGRALGGLLVLSAFLPRSAPLAEGEFRMSVLDVGQGLAVLVTTRRHALLYDAGPRWWSSGRDAGEVVVLPALGAAGIARLDRMIVSHADSDHAGGTPSVLAGVRVGALSVADVVQAPVHARAPPRPCRAGERWRWDEVTFALLHPRAGDDGSRNDRSCVLAVAGAGGRALLPGDVEAGAERRLIARYGAALRADVLIVPHHGSATSSHPAFVRAVRPRLAIVSAGHHNRFGQPAPAVVSRYRDIGSAVLDTASNGTIEVTVGRERLGIDTWRRRRAGFWNAREP